MGIRFHLQDVVKAQTVPNFAADLIPACLLISNSLMRLRLERDRYSPAPRLAGRFTSSYRPGSSWDVNAG
jgi:hypothetical protein